MAKRLWDKGAKLHDRVLAFTVGSDYELDKELVHWDVVGSAAHAQMLHSIDILDKKECSELLKALKKILALSAKGDFEIPLELEDCHTAIENFLIEETGDSGRKIHTGRSRNDQVILATRLYLREKIVQSLLEVTTCIETLLERYNQLSELPMPGYTHMQPAMPSSVGMWLHAFIEALLESVRDGLLLLERINANPLGAASGFGTTLPLNREMTAKLLGFTRVQRSPIDIQNSRGRYELKFIRWGVDIAAIVEKFAWDLILYSSREYGFFNLPEELTTGSSIMPQKRNPDTLELLRARSAKIRSAESELAWVCGKLPSNYHRDLQYTKEPVVKTVQQLSDILPMLNVVIESFSANEETLRGAMSDDLYATYEAFRGVQKGVPFREAYQTAAIKFQDGEVNAENYADDFDRIALTTEKEVREAERELKEVKKVIGTWQELLKEAEERALSAK